MTPAIAKALAALINLVAPELPAVIARAIGEGIEVQVTVRIGPAGDRLTIAPMPPVTDSPYPLPELPRGEVIVTYYGVQTYGTGDPPANVTGRWYTTDKRGEK